jgi:seryl-tRNA synthetase
MHDIKAIRDDPQAFDKGLARRGLPPRAESLIMLDERRRAAITELQRTQERRNALSKQIGVAMARKDSVAAEDYRAQVAGIKATMSQWEVTQREAEAGLEFALAEIPNLPFDDVPDGKDENDNVEVRRWGAPPALAGMNKPREHFEIGEALGLMDFNAAVKLSGSRFVVLKGALARLERGLEQFMLDLHTTEHGYQEIDPPVLVRDEVMYGTGQLPKFKEDQFSTRIAREKIKPDLIIRPLEEFLLKTVNLSSFKNQFPDNLRLYLENVKAEPQDDKIKSTMRLLRNAIVHSNTQPEAVLFSNYLREITSEKDNFETLWLIPTAEVPLTNLVRESIVDEKTLPLRFTAGTLSFRAEAGAAGKDTRGMIRQHQFKKVELVSITTPEEARDEHERMTACAEEVLKRLGLHFRTVVLCAGDMGFASRKTYDIEVWLPGQGRFREISSCSVCGDFQARRMNARSKAADAKSTRFVHTLNGSGVAVGRALVAVLENYQQPDGSVAIPEVLRPYMGGLTRIEAKA